MCVGIVKGGVKTYQEEGLSQLADGDNEEMSVATAKTQRISRRRSSTGSVASKGSCSSRCYVQHNYQDHFFDEAYLPGNSDGTKRRGPRGGVTVPFPERLYNMLDQVEEDGFGDVVSWQPHGRCFLVHNPKRFVAEVMPKYFRQSKLTSFQRQVNLYGFRRLTAGTDRGAYYHELFLRGRPDLHKRLVRIRVKGTGFKSAASPSTEPDFYHMHPCLEGAASSQTVANSMEAPESPRPVVSKAKAAIKASKKAKKAVKSDDALTMKKTVILTPVMPLEIPILASFDDVKPLDTPHWLESWNHKVSSGPLSLTSIASTIVRGEQAASSIERATACPVTPEYSTSIKIADFDFDEDLAMVSPIDSPCPSPCPPELEEEFSTMPASFGDSFQDQVQALVAENATSYVVDNMLIDDSEQPSDYTLDPLLLLDEVVGPVR